MRHHDSACDPKTFLKRYNQATKGFPIHAQTTEDDEGHFSWSPCETCGCTLGGTRYDCVLIKPGITVPARGKPGREGKRVSRGGKRVNVRSCDDCIMYAANGVLPGEG